MLGNWGGQSIWWPRSILIMKTEWKKLRKNNVGNVDAGECLNCTGEKMLHAIFAWGIGKAGLEKILRKLGSWIRTTGINIRRRKRCITRNIARGKLNVKCVSVELGNLIGQDIWEVRSICWGAVVEKLVVMGGVGEDDTKGKARLPSTYIYILYGKIGEVDVVYFVILMYSYGWSIYVWIWLLCPFLYAKCRVNNTQAGDFSWLTQPETEGRWTPHSKRTWRFV